MAVRANDQVTLVELAAPTYVRLFYQLKASGGAAPAVPTTNPPGGAWTTTEPTYTPGTTSTLYTVLLTAYGPQKFEYGPVQVSSSFEAAKLAYNKADGAVATVTIEYAVNTSTTTPPATGWSAARPARNAGEYIWQRTKTTKGNGASSYSEAVIVTGDKGNTGSTGSTGGQGPAGPVGPIGPPVINGDVWDPGEELESFTVFYQVKTGAAPAKPTAVIPPAAWTEQEPETAYLYYPTLREYYAPTPSFDDAPETANGYGGVFTITAPITLHAGEVKTSSSGTLKLAVRTYNNPTMGAIVHEIDVPVEAEEITEVVFDWSLPAGTYYISRVSGPSMYSANEGITYPSTTGVWTWNGRATDAGVLTTTGYYHAPFNLSFVSPSLPQPPSDINDIEPWQHIPARETAWYVNATVPYTILPNETVEWGRRSIGNKVPPREGRSSKLYRTMRSILSDGSHQWTTPEEVVSWDGEDTQFKLAVVYTYVQYSAGTGSGPTGEWGDTKASATSSYWRRLVYVFGDGSSVASAPLFVPMSLGTVNGPLNGMTMFYLLLSEEEYPPFRPETFDPTESGAAWVGYEPEWKEGFVLYKTTRYVYAGGGFRYTPVSKSAAYKAETEARKAAMFANLAYYSTILSYDAPEMELGRVWLRTNDAGEMFEVNICYWEDDTDPSSQLTWQSFAILGGMIVVPGPDGPTVIDRNGVDTTQLLAGAIIATEAFAGELTAIEGQFLTFAGDAYDPANPRSYLDNLEKITARLRVTGNSLSITEGVASESATQLDLTSTKMSFTVGGVESVTIDSESSTMTVDNLQVSDTFLLGSYRIYELGASKNLAFKRV